MTATKIVTYWQRQAASQATWLQWSHSDLLRCKQKFLGHRNPPGNSNGTPEGDGGGMQTFTSVLPFITTG